MKRNLENDPVSVVEPELDVVGTRLFSSVSLFGYAEQVLIAGNPPRLGTKIRLAPARALIFRLIQKLKSVSNPVLI